MKKLMLFMKKHAPLFCACILAGILALSCVWLRDGIAERKKSGSGMRVFSETEKTDAQNKNEYHPPALGEIIVPYALDALVLNATTRVYETHPGTDYLCPDKCVYAVSDGRVESVKTDPMYGLTIVLLHENGDRSLYASLSTSNVKAGARVKMGDVIGEGGTSAQVEAETGPHLHFEYIKGGKSVPFSFTTAPET